MTAPTVGRTVHYRSRGSADGEYPPLCRAAVVTEVSDPVWEEVHTHNSDEPLRRIITDEPVSLAVLNPTGLFFDRHVSHDEGQMPGTWHWVCVRG